MVIWIVGLSGVGKTFYANLIKKKIKKKSIIVDGDQVRKFITYDLGYSKSDRRKNSIMIADICKFLEEQGFIVICPILSIFPTHQKKNRKKFSRYLQIYIESKVEVLKERNDRKIYSKKKDIVGTDIKFPKPYKSDIIIKNNFLDTYEGNIKKIMKLINDKK